MKAIFVTLTVIFSCQLFAHTGPDSQLTPGAICQPSDPDFDHFDYPEKIARCARNISIDEKMQVAANYGNIPHDQWPNYEFDHLIPLCAGGSNSSENLWPQPIAEAKGKDKLENDICLEMRAGTLSQADAIKQVHDWFNNRQAQ